MPAKRSKRRATNLPEVKSETDDTPLPEGPPAKRLRPRASKVSTAAPSPPPPKPIKAVPKRAAKSKAATKEVVKPEPKVAKVKVGPRASTSSVRSMVRSRVKPEPPLDDFVDPTYPRHDEWEDKSIFTRYKTCQLLGNHWAVGDFIHVQGEEQPDGERLNWTARIQHIRAADTTRVFCLVEWVYTSQKMLTQANCRNPPHRRLVSFPTEVVIGQGDIGSGMISIQCINDAARVMHFNEMDALQNPIPYNGTMFYRSRFRPSTDAEIAEEEEQAAKMTGGGRKRRMFNARFPQHEFEHPPSCYCGRPYFPLPAGTDTMIMCPRPGCCKWFHTTCIRKQATPHVVGVEAVADLVASGLELLEQDRERRPDYLARHVHLPDLDAQPIPNISRLPKDENGIPLVLLRAAEATITRGAFAVGVVGSARPILEARAVYQKIMTCIEAYTEPPKRKGRGRKQLVVEIGSSKYEETADDQTKKMLGVWLAAFSHRAKELGVGTEDEKRRVFAFVCPECSGPI